ncbi:unnamed protein product [Brachionus calyciflorus]|uniref:Endonuclease/exonuclease/phosphatase domain-containing protein n=1 Tax=Brachionus calyciflorus TaxID=104777 RepID=A0A814G4C7_9BILA|nr:unnamed protein product [Brachionus calyciflorus]
MFVSNQRNLNLPKEISIVKNNVEVVENFKLLGVAIDKKLTFPKYVAELRTSINKRLYSIKRLFYLSHKRALQKLANTYYNCVHKLLHIKMSGTTVDDFNKLNNELGKYDLECYQHRPIKRISRFIFKIFNNNNSPVRLKMSLTKNCENKTVSYNLMNNDQFFIPSKEDYLFSLDSNLPLLIVGDLNEDLLSEKGKDLKQFMEFYDLKNCITKPTRIKESSSGANFKLTKSLIDVCLHNSIDDFGITLKSDVVGCPFSNHNFICVSLEVQCENLPEEPIYGRNLSSVKVDSIIEELKKVNFEEVLSFVESYRQWGCMKNKIL